MNTRSPTPLCVLGPGRSGTSLTMRTLDLLGVYAGSERDLAFPVPGNPRGNWEIPALTNLNKRILEIMGGDILEPPDLPPGWERSGRLATERDEARALLREIFAGHELWGWKCPLASLTLPFWQQLLPGMRYVICLRNPIDVAASVTKLGHTERPLTVWARYMASALANTEGAPRIFVSYGDYFDDWRSVASRLAHFVGCDVSALEEVGDEIQAAIDHRLCHHRSSVRDLVDNPSVPTEVVSLYLTARELASNQDEYGADVAPRRR